MNVKIIIGKNGEEDMVKLTDGTGHMWSGWLRRTEQAVSTMRAAIDEKRISPEAQAAHAWLVRCGVATHTQFADLEAHLPQLRMPMSAANGRRCQKCGSKIWGKQALLTGLGSECRRGSNLKKTERAARTLSAAA